MIERFTATASGAPTLGPYAQATAAAGLVFTAGQVPLDAAGQAPEDFAAQVEVLIDNLAAALAAAGTDLAHVVKANGYLTEPWQLEVFNEVYARRFAAAPPARTTVCVDLWGVSMELDCVAVRPHPAPEATAPSAPEVPVPSAPEATVPSAPEVTAPSVPGTSDIPQAADLLAVELPTLGHVLEDGFAGPSIRRLAEGPRLLGRARILELSSPDALAVNRTILDLEPGEVLVIRVAGSAHAPIGAVTAHALIAAGAAGVVVDGPVTDLAALRTLAARLPVYCTGLTARTTKQLGTLPAARSARMPLGDTEVGSGDIVLGDEHGILILPPAGINPFVLADALAADAAEPALIDEIAAGRPLHEVLRLPSG